MDPNSLFVIDVVSRVVHVSTAILLLGGSMFSVSVLAPALERLAEEPRENLMTAVLGRWKWYVHFGIVLFLISGGYNYWRALGNHPGDGLYHAMVGTKMLLAFFVFFLASALVGRSEALQKFRDRRLFWTRVLVATALLIVAISGFVKIRGPRTGSDPEQLDPAPQVAPVALVNANPSKLRIFS